MTTFIIAFLILWAILSTAFAIIVYRERAISNAVYRYTATQYSDTVILILCTLVWILVIITAVDNLPQ